MKLKTLPWLVLAVRGRPRVRWVIRPCSSRAEGRRWLAWLKTLGFTGSVDRR